MDDMISRQMAIDAISTWDKFGVDERCRIVRWRDGLEPYVKLRDVITAIFNTPSAEPYTIHSDGRLWVTVDDIDKVNAVVVDESKSKFCKQFYMDAEPERKKGKWVNIVDGIEYTWGTCDTCGARIPMVYEYYEFCPHCGTKNEVEHG